LQQFVAFGGETEQPREAVKAAAGQMMSNAIRPIAEVLTQLPALDPADEPSSRHRSRARTPRTSGSPSTK
jgi:hypothetical protein